MRKSILIIALTIAAAACNTPNDTSEQPGTAKEQAPATPTTDLFGKEWKLSELNGKPVKLDTAFKREPHLVFDKEAGKLTGNGGCNNLMGGFKLKDGNGLEISQVAATMMACPNLGMEGQFLEALKQVRSYHITANHLYLENEKKEIIARLETTIAS